METHENAQPFSIPQRVHDWYNAHYNNLSYRAFRMALTESACYGQLSAAQDDEQFITGTMNLLIDASFERSGADDYAGSEERLMTQIEHLDSRVTTLARLHLMNFDVPDQTDAERALAEARSSAETAARVTSDVHSWRGRVAYAWASAAMFLLHAAHAVLIETADSYVLEKLDRALDHLQNGVVEAESNGFTLSKAFMAWMRRLVKARR